MVALLTRDYRPQLGSSVDALGLAIEDFVAARKFFRSLSYLRRLEARDSFRAASQRASSRGTELARWLYLLPTIHAAARKAEHRVGA